MVKTHLSWGCVQSKSAHVSDRTSGTWIEFAKIVTAHTVSAEKGGPGWLPADIPPGPRTATRASEWSVLALDIEAKASDENGVKTVVGPMPPPMPDAAETLRLFGWAGALATSYNHEAPANNGTLGPRYRIVLPVSRPIAVHEIKPLATGVAGFLGLLEYLDTNSLDAARLFYLPRVPKERAHLAQRAIVDGSPLDVDSFLPSQDLARVSGQSVAIQDEVLSALRVALSDLELSDLRSATMYLAGVKHGSNYGDWQATGAALHSEAHGGREPELQALWLEYSKACGGYKSDADVLRKWREVGGEKSSKAAIFSKATERGWVNPAIGRKHVGQTTLVVPNATRYKLLGSKELRDLPPIDWRIRHVFPTSGVVALYGPSSSGKSFLALDMAAAIAEGKMWFNHRVKPAPVTYLVLEGEAGFRLRFDALESHWGHPMPDGLRLVLQPMQLTKPQDIEDFAAAVPPSGVVYIDTLNRAAPDSDENSSKDMGLIVEGGKRLQSLTGGLVVLIHHTGKDGDRGMRGHSSLFAAMDAVIEVKRDKDNPGARCWRVAKSKDDEDGKSHSFKLVTVPLGNDAGGEPVSSCVVEPISSVTGKPKLSTYEQIVLGTLQGIESQCATRDQLRAEFYSSGDGKPDGTKRQAFGRAVQGLLSKGIVSEGSGNTLFVATLLNAA